MIDNYCKSYNFGHSWLQDYFQEPVTIEEKYDGSQLSFGIFDGNLKFKSRNRHFDVHTADDLFRKTTDHIELVQDKLVPEMVYRGECFKGPKHNVLKYDRAPVGNFVLFEAGPNSNLETTAKRLGVECVKTLDSNVLIQSLQHAEDYLNNESSLGGTKVEGVVFKRRKCPLFNHRDQLIMAKLVSPLFREKHNKEHTKETRTTKTLVDKLIATYGTPMRFQKAFQHLQEDGKLSSELKDIRPLIAQVKQELWEDHLAEIINTIVLEIKKPLERGLVRGLPEWYKTKLAESQFE